ncbi:MAG: M23 family metallopeptidase [Acidobacteriota bacterium]
MKKITLLFKLLIVISLILIPGLTVSTQVKTPETQPVPVDLEVLFAPIPVKAMDETNLVYELHITNFSPSNLALTGVEVLNDANSASLAIYRGEEVVKRLAVLNFSNDKQEKNVIGGGQRAVVFLMVSVDAAKMPTALRHRLFFKSADKPTDADNKEPAKEQIVEDMRVEVQIGAPLVVAPPLRGRWLAGNGLSNDTGHRRSIKAIGGHAKIAQRFATDWVELGNDGRLARNGDMSQNANYYGYGAEVLAVANATVIDVKDGIPENIPQIKKRAVPITLETIAGNYVLLDIGGGRYALYAHLQPNSLKVKIGDKVKTGQVLGSVGNSGNSDLPHLHFHIVNAASPLAAEGVPYVLKSFNMQGITKVDAEFIKNGFKPDASAESKRQMEIPIQNAVVIFP